MDGGNAKERKRMIFIKVIVGALLAAAILSFIWQIEQLQPIHLTTGKYAEISTRYYVLHVPRYWRRCVTVTQEPSREIYKGYLEGGQNNIDKNNYSLVFKYKTNGEEYPVAKLSMYQYVQDRMEEKNQENWVYWGQLCRHKYNWPYGNNYMILDYDSVPSELSAEEQQQWQVIADELSSEMLYDNVGVFINQYNSRYPQGVFKNWALLEKEERQEEAKRKREIEQKRQEEEEKSSSKSSSSTAKVCKYSGCRKWAVSYCKGYCHTHYEQVYGKKRDDYYDEDPESYYNDNKDIYRSYDEAEDGWYDEYEED